jgi:2-polyprenyl-3-methyl-5-hydroxy-6-metoxy-1,4-benzoquinol methylase
MANCAANDALMAHPPLEEIPCPLCGETGFRPIHRVWNRLSQSTAQAQGEPQEGTFSIVACISCGFLYLNPRPALQDLGRYYPVENYDPHRRSGGGLTGFFYRALQPLSLGWKARMVSQGQSPGRLLDVGCGRGEFLSLMRRRGWQVLGVEKDSAAAALSQAEGNPTLTGDPVAVALPAEEFEVVTFWHSLEHLPDLKAVVARMAPRIKSGGLLAVAVPNPQSLDARFYGRRWVAWDAPRHLVHFRPQDMETLWEPHGLRLIGIRSLPLDPFYASLLSETSWTSGIAAALKALRGLVVGGVSFLVGLKSGCGSSNVYLFSKE